MWCHFRPLLSPLDSWRHGLRVALQNCFLWIHLFIASVKKATSPQDSPEGLQRVLGRDQSWGRAGAPGWGSWGGSACRKGGSGGAFSLSPDPSEESAASWGWFLLSSNKWQDKGKQPWSVLGRFRLNIGAISSLKGWSGIGRGCPGQGTVPIPGGIPRHVNGGPGDMSGVALAVLNDLRGLFQPEWFYNSKHFFQGEKETILASD